MPRCSPNPFPTPANLLAFLWVCLEQPSSAGLLGGLPEGATLPHVLVSRQCLGICTHPGSQTRLTGAHPASFSEMCSTLSTPVRSGWDLTFFWSLIWLSQPFTRLSWEYFLSTRRVLLGKTASPVGRDGGDVIVCEELHAQVTGHPRHHT